MTEDQFLQTSRQVFALVRERIPERFAELDVQDARADTKDPVVFRYAAISKNKADLWHINFCSYNLVFSPKAAGVGLWHTPTDVSLQS